MAAPGAAQARRRPPRSRHHSSASASANRRRAEAQQGRPPSRRCGRSATQACEVDEVVSRRRRPAARPSGSRLLPARRARRRDSPIASSSRLAARQHHAHAPGEARRGCAAWVAAARCWRASAAARRGRATDFGRPARGSSRSSMRRLAAGGVDVVALPRSTSTSCGRRRRPRCGRPRRGHRLGVRPAGAEREDVAPVGWSSSGSRSMKNTRRPSLEV